MKFLVFLIFMLNTVLCFSQSNHRSDVYKKNLSEKTFIQKNIVKPGDTMIFKFSLDDTLEYGYSKLLHNGNALFRNLIYSIDCKTTNCHIDFSFWKYNEKGKAELTGEVNKGLIEFLKPDKFRIRFNSKNQKNRPHNFIPPDHPDIFIFENEKQF